MNTKIIIGVFTLLLIIGGVWYITSGKKINLNTMPEVAEHNDSLESFEVSPSTVVKRVNADEGVILLDVRTPEEYEEVHLKNALLLPVEELTAKTLSDIGLGEAFKDKEIIIYCRSGGRSKIAYNIMQSLGYTNIKSVAGGMLHWQEDKYPLTESGPYSGLSATSGSDKTISKADGAKIVVDRDSHNFGEVAQYGGTVKTDFTVTNTGSAKLEIGDITTSCSCTKATISSVSIEPGDSATLAVVFDPNLHAEPLDVFKRTVFIPTNDSANPEMEVTIRVDILEGE